MAVKSRSSIWQQLHLLARLIGVTGLAAALVGWFIWGPLGQEEIGLIVLCSSAGAVGLALLFEVRGITQAVASHRGLFGFNVILQVALALALVVGANVYSFEHFRRFDLTRAQIFTLDDATRDQMQQLRGDTDIIIVQKYVSFGQRSENKQDKYDFAAQRKIVEKVKDLAEQFEDLGPRFHVHVLDVQEDSYDTKVAALRAQVLGMAEDEKDSVVKKTDAQSKTITLAGDKEDLTLTVSAETQVMNAAGQKIDDLFTDKAFEVGAVVAYRADAVNNLKKIKDVSAKAKVAARLVKAIENAPENSVIVFSRDKERLQRISFSEIYQLDKQGSIEQKNLVLKYQGVGPFARKIFNIEEKTPRIATAVIHPVLGFTDKRRPEFTMSGSKKILDAYGFDCTDIALRRITDEGRIGDPTVLTHDESLYEEIEDELADLAAMIKSDTKDLEGFNAAHKFWSESSMAELNKKYAYFILPDGREGITLRAQVEKIKKAVSLARFVDVDEDDRRNMTTKSKALAERVEHALKANKEDVKELEKKKVTLRVDNLAEKRRFTDLEAKAKAALADVDLLIVPRITLIDVPQGEVVPYRIHKLETAQLNAVKAFLKQGKPVLFLLGPPDESRSTPDMGIDGPDALEPMLAELGFYLPKQTILYKAEMREYNERKFGGFGASKREVELPGVRFDEKTSTYTWSKKKEDFTPHPIRVSMRMMSRVMASTDSDAARAKGAKDGANEIAEKKDTPQLGDASVIRVRHPRPVYFMRTILPPTEAASVIGSLSLPGMPGAVQAATTWVNKAQRKPEDNGVFLVTPDECWNEENPFIVQGKVPVFTPTKDDDPKKGTADEERDGPFPIGVAVEAQVPASWLDKDAGKAPKVRVAVIGSGGVFVGPNLPPLKEKLLLDTVNWLLGRDDLLARDAESWEYPRVALSPLELKCWYALAYGMPILFIYLGTVVWLVRRMR